MMEAKVRHLLHENGITVRPAVKKEPNDRCPDFFCTRNEYRFYVEVTCLSLQKVTRVTGLPHFDQAHVRARSYSNLNKSIWSECVNKVVQCANQPYPVLIAVGTHHVNATPLCFSRPKMNMLLTGTTKITSLFYPDEGSCSSEFFLSTDLKSAVFLKPDVQHSTTYARSPISGILTCGMGSLSPIVHCLLNPNPVHAFDESVLPDVPVGKILIDQESGSLSTVWREGRMKKDDDDVDKICDLFN